MLYVVIYVFMALATYRFRESQKSSNYAYSVFVLLLFLFSAFRFKVGCDWQGYLLQFSMLGSGDSHFSAKAAREPLWWQSMQIVQDLKLSYPWINVFSSAIFFLGAHILARTQPNRLAFLTVLYPILIIALPMSGVRQAAAIGLICIAFITFAKNQPVRFTILTLAASGFHNSALVFLLCAPLAGGRLTSARLVLAGVLAIPGLYFLLSTEAAEFAMKSYVETGLDAFGAVYRVGLLALSGIFFLRQIRQPWAAIYPSDYKLANLGAWMMVTLLPVLALSTVIADRFGYYLVPIQAIIFGRLPYLALRKRGQTYFFWMLLALGLVLLVWVSFSGLFQQCYSPYRTWLFGMPDESFSRFSF